MNIIETNDRYSKSYKKEWRGSMIVQKKTSCATATIMNTVDFGETVLLDGEIQSTAADEALYHAALTVPVLLTANSGRAGRVCILGGGEGCTARNILDWPTVKHVDQVDYDREFVQLCAKYLWHWTNHVYCDSRLSVEYNDAWAIINERRKYDGVCIDLIDFDTTSQADFDRAVTLLKGATMWLNPGGSLTMFIALDSPSTMKFINKLEEHIKREIDGVITKLYKKYIPSFAGEAYFIYVSLPMYKSSYTNQIYGVHAHIPSCISTGIFIDRH